MTWALPMAALVLAEPSMATKGVPGRNTVSSTCH